MSPADASRHEPVMFLPEDGLGWPDLPVAPGALRPATSLRPDAIARPWSFCQPGLPEPAAPSGDDEAWQDYLRD